MEIVDSSSPSLQERTLCSVVPGGRISAGNFPQGTPPSLEVPHVVGLVSPMHALAQHLFGGWADCSLHLSQCLELPEKEEA